MAGESITFSFGADTAGLTGAIDGLLGKLAGLAAAFLSAQAVVQAFSEAIDLGGRLNDLSARTGETAGNLALLERAFTNTSVGADKVGPAISKMQVAITDFAQGSDKAVAAFEQLGLSLEDLQQHTPTEQMQMIGERLAAIYDPALRAATAVDIFGRSGAELLPVLTNFSAEMGEASSQLGSLPEMLDRTAAEVDSLGDNLAAIKNKGIEMAYGFLSEVVPAVDLLASKLAGMDAAGIGAGLADALVGAFVSPMKAAELLGETLLYGVKLMGNEMVYQIRYWTELLFNTFMQIGANIIPMLGDNMRGAFELAIGSFGTVLVSTITGALESLSGIAGVLGFGSELDTAIAKVQGVQETLDTVMASGAERIASNAEKFSVAFDAAKAASTVVKEDIFGAAEASIKMGERFTQIKADAEATVAAFSSTETAESRTTTGTGVDPLMNILINENKVTQTAITTGGGTTAKGKTDAQLFAEAMKALGLVADADIGTAVGRSASAQKALDLQKQIASATALGASPERIQQLSDSLRANLDIALGAGQTAADREAAAQFARDFLNDPRNTEGLGFTELEDLALQNLQERKEDQLGITDIMKKSLGDKQAEATKQAGQQPQQAKQATTILGIAQELLKLMQKVEPRIPVGNLV